MRKSNFMSQRLSVPFILFVADLLFLYSLSLSRSLSLSLSLSLIPSLSLSLSSCTHTFKWLLKNHPSPNFFLHLNTIYIILNLNEKNIYISKTRFLVWTRTKVVHKNVSHKDKKTEFLCDVKELTSLKIVSSW